MSQAAQASDVLRGRSITSQYGPIQVVFGVDLDVKPGEVLAVLGPNGAGKSSLLGTLAGTVQGGGEQTVGGISIGGLNAHRRARLGLAFVPEARRNLFPSLSVGENLEIGLSLSPPGAREALKRSILALFPILTQRFSTQASMLSGGEQQMLAISVALGRSPQVLMLDEPTQGLAPAVFDILEDAFSRLRQTGLAILLAEQNLAFASRVASRYIVLSHGQAVGAGGREDLADHDRISAAYFEAENA